MKVVLKHILKNICEKKGRRNYNSTGYKLWRNSKIWK